MRRTAITLLALGLLALVATPSFAARFWTETFTYSDGGLVANSSGNWVGHSTSTTYTDIQVGTGEAILIGANGQDDSRNFTEQSATASTYGCFKFKLVGTGTSGTVYFAHFKNTGTFFCARVFAIVTSATQYNLGINSTSTVPTGAAIWATPLNKGQYYTLAIKYNAQTGASTLWVDPSSEASTSVSNSDAGVIGTLVSGFALRQSSFANHTIYVDNIEVGDVFSDLCPSPTPTRSGTWGSIKSLYR
jgi:hypothetical protein